MKFESFGSKEKEQMQAQIDKLTAEINKYKIASTVIQRENADKQFEQWMEYLKTLASFPNEHTRYRETDVVIAAIEQHLGFSEIRETREIVEEIFEFAQLLRSLDKQQKKTAYSNNMGKSLEDNALYQKIQNKAAEIIKEYGN